MTENRCDRRRLKKIPSISSNSEIDLVVVTYVMIFTEEAYLEVAISYSCLILSRLLTVLGHDFPTVFGQTRVV